MLWDSHVSCIEQIAQIHLFRICFEMTLCDTILHSGLIQLVKKLMRIVSNERAFYLELVFLKYENEVGVIEYDELIVKFDRSLISLRLNHATQCQKRYI